LCILYLEFILKPVGADFTKKTRGATLVTVIETFDFVQLLVAKYST